MCIHFYSIGSYRYYRSEPSGFRITCLTARHFSGRFLRRIPRCGLHSCSKDALRSISAVTAATMPISRKSANGSRISTLPSSKTAIQRRLAVYPYDARTASGEIHELDAAKVLPVHNSKFSLSRHAWDEPIHRIEQAATKDSSLHVIHGIIGSPIIY